MITFPMSKGNTISPVAELTIRMLVMDPKKKITWMLLSAVAPEEGSFFKRIPS